MRVAFFAVLAAVVCVGTSAISRLGAEESALPAIQLAEATQDVVATPEPSSDQTAEAAEPELTITSTDESTEGIDPRLLFCGAGISEDANLAATTTPAVAQAEEATPPAAEAEKEVKATAEQVSTVTPGRVPAFVTNGVKWLIAAQNNDGGWGGGSHAHQDVMDPHAVTTDPATTSFTLLALLRGGHTPVAGEYKDQVRKGLEYLVAAVEKAPKEGALITMIEGTQPQSKLGRYVDTAMTAQYLARALALLPKDDAMHPRVDKALDVCLAKLQQSQQENGSWGEGGGWAPVLQSSLSCSALELASASGKKVDAAVLTRARQYQKGNFNVESGRADASAGAGVELYAFNGAFRGNAVDARQAGELIDGAKAAGKLAADAPVNEENLQVAGAAGPQARALAEAAAQNSSQMQRLGDEQLLSGFGNNGGEEFLSYLMTSETLLIAGGDKFHEWQDKMQGRLAKIQNTDGSWSGHHCISSPVFCTAAVVQCLAADQDAEFLLAMAKRTTEGAEKVAAVDASGHATPNGR
jgi:hypothetical protein